MWAVRACGARARERAESSGAERGEGTGQRDSIADGTALRYIVGEEVAATFGDTEALYPEGSLFVSLRATGSLLTIFLPLTVRQKTSERRDDRKT